MGQPRLCAYGLRLMPTYHAGTFTSLLTLFQDDSQIVGGW